MTISLINLHFSILGLRLRPSGAVLGPPVIDPSGWETHEGWLVGCFGLNGPLRQYFSLYRAVSQREGERKKK